MKDIVTCPWCGSREKYVYTKALGQDCESCNKSFGVFVRHQQTMKESGVLVEMSKYETMKF